MFIETRSSKGVTILAVHGKFTIEEGSAEVRAGVRELVEAGQRKIVLNLGNVTYIDSTGIESLVSSYTTVVRSGGALKFSNLPGRIRHLLEITRLLTVFEAHEDEEQAATSFA